MTWRLLPAGERGVLAELDDLDAVLTLDATLTTLAAGGDPPWHAVEDRVPAARTLLLTVRDPRDLGAVTDALGNVLAALGVHFEVAIRPLGRPKRRLEPHTGAEVVELAVHYDGPDLAEVARLCGLSADEVVAAHTGRLWRVGFAGFAPGFAYLVDGDPRLRAPRRTEPRTTVPAGSVGLAGAFSGIYPRSSPGGWQLIGRTDAALFDVDRDPPALLRPGAWVRFVAAP